MARLLPMGSIGDERLEDLRSRLDAIAEELADLGYAKLAEAARLAQAGERSRGARQADDAGTGTGSAEADAAERRIGRARRSVLRAAALLSDSGEAGAGDEYG